jgi:hypothetical protein
MADSYPRRDHNYFHILVSVIHPTCDMTINRYCLGIDSEDPRIRNFDIDRWAEPEMRNQLLPLLCEDWISEGCAVVACEEIAGAVQWGRIDD